MVKKQTAAAPAPLDLTGSTESRSIVRASDTWAEFELSDGTKIRIKPVLGEAKRLVGQHAPDKQPAYLLGLGMITVAIGPKKLQFGQEKTAAEKKTKKKTAKRRKK